VSGRAAARGRLRGKAPRSGELLALLGAVAIVVSLALPWYEAPAHALDAWETFGVAIVLLMIAALAGLVLFAATLAERSTAVPVVAGIFCTVLGLVGVIASIVRLLERPHAAGALCAGPWVALGGALLIFAGAWQSMRDERSHRYPPAQPTPREPPPTAP
jgi:lysylphosphatidylglycerol synthetase-like protein (DUF2156 family)